jgi:hypothetical protein
LKALCKLRTGVQLEQFPVVRKNLFAGAANLRGKCLPQIHKQAKNKSLLM